MHAIALIQQGEAFIKIIVTKSDTFLIDIKRLAMLIFIEVNYFVLYRLTKADA